jgi:hypothetical protein
LLNKTPGCKFAQVKTDQPESKRPATPGKTNLETTNMKNIIIKTLKAVDA